MTLRGPAHPDTFRTQVGRYGDRFYVDPLPACDIAPATDEHWPSVSIVKGAWPKNLGQWMAAEAARFAVEHRDTWVNLPEDAAIDMIAKASDRSRNKAADRGTEAHRLLENIAAGQEPDEVWIPDAVPYLPVLRQLVADLKLTPESFVMTEAVCISRTLGYGGTADAAIRIDAGDLSGVYAVDWKGLATFTPLPTPTGWTTMGAVRVGDELIGSDGNPCTVTGKSSIHERDCYRIRFDDGAEIVADNEHLWVIERGGSRLPEIISTEEMAATCTNEHGRTVYRVRNSAPVELPDVDLPVGPYTLGAWLGDGCRNRGSISKPSDGMWDAIEAEGYRLGRDYNRNNDQCRTHTVLGLAPQLREAGVLERKHVPDIYLRASRSQRLELLRGLMDTDGGWNKVRRHAGFDNTNKELALAVHELVCSLGWRASWYEGDAHGFGRDVHFYRVSFRPFDDNPFRARAHMCADDLGGTLRSRRRIVKSVERCPTVPTQCVEVDSPDSTYLAGEALIPTHNTRKPGRHDASRDECAQLAAYARCDYIFAEVGGQAVRAPAPKVDGGLIVSITPDDYRLYPVDLDAAWETFTDLRRFWDTTKRVVRSRHVTVPRASVPEAGGPADDGDPFDGLTPMADAEAARTTESSPSVAPVTPAPDTEGTAPGVGGTASPERWAWMRGRLLAIVAADAKVPIAWPDGVAPLKPGNSHTDDELDAIAEALVPWEAKLQISFPAEPDPGRSDVTPPEVVAGDDPTVTSPRVAKNDPRVVDLGARAMALPPDLLLELEAEAVTARKIPNLSSGRATEDHLAIVADLLAPLEARAEDRATSRDLALSLCQASGVEPITALHLVAPDRGSDRLTEWEVDALDDLAVALSLGAVVTVGDDGKVATTVGAESALIEAQGGKREVLAAARQIAKGRRWPSPSSSADVAANPLLAAAVSVADRAADVA